MAPLRRVPRHTSELVHPATFDPATARRRLTVAMTGSAALPMTGALVRVVAQQAPGVELTIRTLPMTGVSDAVLTHDRVDVLLLPRAFESAFEREPLHDDAWVVITGPRAPRAPVEDLVTSLPHVVLDSPGYRVRPYEILDARGIGYAVRTRVSDNLLIPHIVAASRSVAFHRARVVHPLAEQLGLWVDDLPWPVDPIGVDVVWNPWLADSGLRDWFGGVLRDVVQTSGLRS